MLPAFVSSLAFKIGAPIVAAALLGGAYWGWKEYQQHIGAKEERERQNVELMQQQQESTQHTIDMLTYRDRAVEEHRKTIAKLQESLEDARHEVDKYKRSKTKPCPVTREFVRVFDAIGSVRHLPPAEERTPAASSSTPGIPDLSRGSGADSEPGIIPDWAILEVNQIAREKHAKLLEKLEGLSKYTVGEYEKRKAFHDAQQEENHD